MSSLSVGQVSALIAAGTTALQVLLPLAIPLILIAFINKQHDQADETAVTWSALSRTLHSTYWPTILSSDSSASTNVNPAVVSAVYLGIFTTILVSVTAVVTPLGLYDAVVSHKPRSVSFSYAQDMTPFGNGSPPRNDMGFNRICGRGSISCPGSNFSVIRTDNPDNLTYNFEWPDGYYTNISLETQNLWASGLDIMQSSVSSMFDIQWRSYEIRQQDLSNILPVRFNYTFTPTVQYYDNGSPYVVGGYRPIQGLLSSNGFKIIEGLVVDSARGGIGFRNHTIPSQPSPAATWTEDILFIVPETSCVDNNLTVDYDLKEDGLQHSLGPGGILRLTDRGGFANLESTFNVGGMHMDSSQDSVRLHDRALFGASKNNAYTMLYMNLTNDEHMQEWRGYEKLTVGTSYLFEDTLNSTTAIRGKLAESLPKPGRIALHRLGQYLDLPFSTSSNHSSIYTENRFFSNPHNVTTRDFDKLEYIVQGRVDDYSLANISNIAINAGMLYPPPRPIGRDLNPFDRGKPGDTWTQPIYTCVSASRATIKTVTFLYNGTGGLSGLHIINATEKSYPNTSSMPVWGVEDSGLVYRQITPLWGLLNPAFAGKPNISSVRKESLWLPGFTSILSSVVDSTMNIPGASFYSTIMAYIYRELLDGSSKIQEIHDYTGYAQFALYQKWLELGQTPRQSADIINLIWTDIAANAVVGTRGWLSQAPGSNTPRPQDQSSPHKVRDVTLFERSTRYHIVYAVPAVLLLFLTLIMSLTTAILVLLRRTGLNRMKWFLNQTSLGRNLTALLYSDVSSQQSTQKAWAKKDAHRLVTVALDRPYAGSQLGIVTCTQPKEDTMASQCLIDGNDIARPE